MCQGRHGNILDRIWFQTIDTLSQDVVCYTYNNDHQRQYDVEPHRLPFTQCQSHSIFSLTLRQIKENSTIKVSYLSYFLLHLPFCADWGGLIFWGCARKRHLKGSASNITSITVGYLHTFFVVLIDHFQKLRGTKSEYNQYLKKHWSHHEHLG